MKCYSFLTNKEYTQALIRLTKMIRGIGNPLVAAYARAYLCRVGMSIAPESRMHLIPNFTDYLTTYCQVALELSLLAHLTPHLPSLPPSFLPSLPPSFFPPSLLTPLPPSLPPPQVNTDQVQNTLVMQGLDMSEYLYLYWPAVEWILQCIAHRATEVHVHPISMVLNHHLCPSVGCVGRRPG